MNQVVEFIEAERAEHPISQMCKVLNVSRAAFYKTCERMKNPSKRKASDAALSQEIKLVHQNSKGCYGARRIYKALKNMNRKCSRKRVERLMREMAMMFQLAIEAEKSRRKIKGAERLAEIIK